MLETLNQTLAFVNGIIWHQYVIIFLLLAGILFTLLTKLTQLRSLTHGVGIVLGRHDGPSEPGAISHFQALTSALSATVGVGNIGGTALAISLGGPGALFWMWIVGFLGMALKTMEVTVSMLFRNHDESGTYGGPMWVAANGFKSPAVGKFMGSLFCVTLLIATFTGGLFFQAWNASNITQQNFGIPSAIVGLVLMLIVGMVILGGIQRIGNVTSRIVPLMCGLYLLAGCYVILINLSELPGLFALIFNSAFSESEATGAFVGGTMGAVFVRGMQQAFFSNESGQGSSPIVHAAAKTKEPVREGVVAGLEPFIDTIVVCTLTGLVILLSGVWNRDVDFNFERRPQFQLIENRWQLENSPLPTNAERTWVVGDQFFCITQRSGARGNSPLINQTPGTVVNVNGRLAIEWQPINSAARPTVGDGFFFNYAGASLTAHAFDQAYPGLGRWLVTLATWLFGISTMISWSYYGEQGVVFLIGRRGILPYRVIFCAGIFVSTLGLVRSQTELTHLANLGTGIMLWVNVPLTLLFAKRALDHYDDYFSRMKETPQIPTDPPTQQGTES